jgi:2-amino-4-hydroxy-6-hydroxymethyldihydropteridine diphosphokinase
VRVVRASSVYETAPQGEVRDQPDFLNACVEIETVLGPEALLDACKAVERELGRASAGMRHGPRPIDVDLLLLGDERYESDRLRIPHRDLATRRFALEPLRELAPALVSDAMLASVADQAVRRAEGSLRPTWRAAVEAHDLDALREVLAPDARLRSPITVRIPFEGRERVLELMEEVFDLLEAVRVIRDVRDGSVQILEIESRLAGYDVHLVQVVEHDDDERVRRITLFMRPLPGVANLAAHLGPRLVRRRRGPVVAALVAPPMKLTAAVLKVTDRLGPRFA